MAIFIGYRPYVFTLDTQANKRNRPMGALVLNMAR